MVDDRSVADVDTATRRSPTLKRIG